MRDLWPPPEELLYAVGKMFGMSSWTHTACNVFAYHRETFWTADGDHRSNEAGAWYEFGRALLP